MAKYLLLYTGGSPPKSAEEGQQVMANWMAWFGRLGPKILDGGAPLGDRQAVNGGTPSAAAGYSLIEAESLAEAVALTQGHPHTLAGGGVEVIETNPIQV